MNKWRVTRSAIFVFVITATALSMLQLSADAAGKQPTSREKLAAACEGLACNDPSDCGSHCFCNNPTDKVGVCFKDEEAIAAFLKAQGAAKPSRQTPQQR